MFARKNLSKALGVVISMFFKFILVEFSPDLVMVPEIRHFCGSPREESAGVGAGDATRGKTVTFSCSYRGIKHYSR